MKRKLIISYYKITKTIKKLSRTHHKGMDLKDFLSSAELDHLYDKFREQGMELKYLLLANDNDLSDLAPRINDKIKLRNAIKLHKKAETDSPSPASIRDYRISTFDNAQESSFVGESIAQSEEVLKIPTTSGITLDQDFVALPIRDESFYLDKSVAQSEETFKPPSASGITLSSNQNLPASDKSFMLELSDEEWQFVQEIGPLQDKKPLKDLLESTTFGKILLKKQCQTLNPRERKSLVQLIVEHQLRTLPSINDTIRQDVWISWANEICTLFKGEHAEVYYVPYRVTERQALPASGLLHNRLITHRRFLTPGGSRKRISSSSSSSSSSSEPKRLRPFPPTFNAPTEEDPDKCVEWLEASSSPFDMVMQKWKNSFKARHEILKEKTIEDYVKQFPSLGLPTGHVLLTSDFEETYPSATDTFDENFPIIKKKLLELLVEKGADPRAEPAVCELLNLATVGEEQGSIAALRSIPYLLKQVAPIGTKIKGKKWKPSRSEVSQAFLSFVSSPGDISRCVTDRMALAQKAGIAFGPFIIAVGTSWSNTSQYEVVVSKDLRYQFSDIKSTLQTTFKIYFALDLEYIADAAACWMFVQRAIYKIATKFDVLYDKSVTLREFIKDCEK